MMLADKIEESRSVIEYAVNTFNVLATAFSGGKDSLVVLHLIRTFFKGIIPFPVFSIDTGVKFPEVIKFRDKIAQEWDFHLIVLKDAEAPSAIKTAPDKKACCWALKIRPLQEAILSYGIQGLITGIRWDEHETREGEQHISPRDSPPHTRIHPILHFTETDVWDYIHVFDLPYCPLYNQGYRSLSCIPCTERTQPALGERHGRAKEKEEIMKDLRLLGYF